jgi:hypothetical protein
VEGLALERAACCSDTKPDVQVHHTKPNSPTCEPANWIDDVSNTTEIQAIYKKHRPQSAWYETLGNPDYLGDYVHYRCAHFPLHPNLTPPDRSRWQSASPLLPASIQSPGWLAAHSRPCPQTDLLHRLA